MMNVVELHKELGAYIEHGIGDWTVRVKTQDRSVGASSAIAINSTSTGFDWDTGTVFLTPSHPLTSKPSRYLNRFNIVRRESGGIEFWACPECLMKVAKHDSYCRHCGTRIM